jgi:hypothetical protein
MLTVGVILLIIGAVVAIAAGGRDPAIRVIGIGVALLGLVLLIVAVLPEDAHGAAGVMVLPFWSRWRRRRRARVQIDPEFARVLAAHVAVGVARITPQPTGPGDDTFTILRKERGRAQSSLATIGIMLLNATNDPVVQETLRTDIEVTEQPGVTTLRRVG